MELTLKQLEDIFNIEQQLDIPYRDRWHNSDFDKREIKSDELKQNKND